VSQLTATVQRLKKQCCGFVEVVVYPPRVNPQIAIKHSIPESSVFGAVPQRRGRRKSGGDLEQIKFLLGHSSIQTTERYLGSEQEIVVAVNDNLGL
jgi:hypothetical protein